MAGADFIACALGGLGSCAIAAGDVAVGAATDGVTGNILERLQQEFAETTSAWISQVMSSWMSVPSANPLTTGYDSSVPSNPQLVPALEVVRDSLSMVPIALGILGIFAVVVRSVVRNSAHDLIGILKLLGNVIAVSLFGVTAVWIGIQWSDAYAPWILERVQTEISSPDLGTALFSPQALAASGFVTSGIVTIIVMLGSLAQMVAMLFRGALLMVFLSIWPSVAASTATETGRAAFKKMNAWILALILYKPVAATIYALGLLLMYTGDRQAASATDSLLNLVYGCTILILGALALPALIKFVAPPAGIGASNFFSGGAALATLATGAIAAAGLAGGAGAAAAKAGSTAAAGGGAATAGGQGAQAALSAGSEAAGTAAQSTAAVGGGSNARAAGAAGSAQAGAAGTTEAPASPSGGDGSSTSTTPQGATGDATTPHSADGASGGSALAGGGSGSSGGGSSWSGGSVPAGGGSGSSGGGSSWSGGSALAGGGSGSSGGGSSWSGGSALAGGGSGSSSGGSSWSGGSVPAGGGSGSSGGGSSWSGGSIPAGGGTGASGGRLPSARPVVRGPKNTSGAGSAPAPRIDRRGLLGGNGLWRRPVNGSDDGPLSNDEGIDHE